MRKGIRIGSDQTSCLIISLLEEGFRDGNEKFVRFTMVSFLLSFFPSSCFLVTLPALLFLDLDQNYFRNNNQPSCCTVTSALNAIYFF